MKDIYILAIESSCDETAMAIVKNGNIVVSHIINSQADEFSKLGGVVPEMASRMHLDNIGYVYLQTLKKADMRIDQIDAIAVTYGPGLVGSLLVGVNFANTLSMIHDIPIVAVNHMQAHIYALSIEHEIQYPMLSLIVSGGHTEIVYVEKEMEFKIIGQTLDDAAGESFDKVAKMLKLGYPGGPLIDQLAKDGKKTYKLPTPLDDKSLDFSFSGLKSACFNMINTANMKGEVIESRDFAASFQSTVVEILLKKLKAATNMYDVNTLSIVGGVSANSYLQKRALEEFDNCIIPSLILSTDNAAMIGVVGFHLYNRKEFVKGVLNAKPGIDVECMWKD